MTALEDSMRVQTLAEWHGPTDVDGVVKMLALTPALGTTDVERVRRWLGEPGSRYVPATLRAALEDWVARRG